MPTIDNYLSNGYGTTITIRTSSWFHVLSVWGYEYNEYGEYTGLYFTDNNDGAHADWLRYLDIHIADIDVPGYGVSEQWVLDGDGTNWFYDDYTWWIAKVKGFEQYPVPIPSALWLLGSGLIGMFGIRRKFKK
jgi:hypothetical protein